MASEGASVPSVEAPAERCALHIGHHIEQKPIGLPRLEQRQDVRRLQLRGDVDLAQEAFGADGLRELRAKHLDRDKATMLDVAREVDGGHAAVAEFAVDGVAAGEGDGEAGVDVAHKGSECTAFPRLS